MAVTCFLVNGYIFFAVPLQGPRGTIYSYGFWHSDAQTALPIAPGKGLTVYGSCDRLPLMCQSRISHR